MSLAGRIKEVMGEVPPGEFAKACGVSAGAVTQWITGDTKTLKAEPVAHMEARYGYRASWIVLGKGPKKLADHSVELPLSPELQQKVLRLHGEELLKAENVLRAHLGLTSLAALENSTIREVIHGKSSQDAYAGATEEGVGLPDNISVPTSSTHGGSQKVRRPARQKGRGGA